MALVTLDGGQSSAALAGQSTLFLQQKIAMEFPAAPDTLIASKLSDCIREFYTNSGAWREVIGPYNVSALQQVLHVNPVDQYSQFQYVLNAFIFPSTPGGNQEQPMRPSPRRLFGLSYQNPGPYPLWYWMETPDRMHLYPPPQNSLGKTLWVYGILLPLVNTPRLPPIATTHHLDALVWGTLWRMYMMPKKPWTDATLASQYRKEFKREMLRWRDVANRSYSNATAPWTFPSFAGRNNHGTSQWGVRG